MNITKLITNSIVIAGITLTALAESANAQAAGKHSGRGGDEENVAFTFNLVKQRSNKPIKIGTNTVLFKGAIKDLIQVSPQASLNTISAKAPVVFNPNGIPVNLAKCQDEGVIYNGEVGKYVDGSKNLINFEFDASGKVTSPSCANTLDSFERISSANLKVQLIKNDPNFDNRNTIQYSIIAPTSEKKVLANLGKIDLSKENKLKLPEDFDQNKAINRLSYIIRKKILTYLRIEYNSFGPIILLEDKSY
jgi:hypothetical protein